MNYKGGGETCALGEGYYAIERVLGGDVGAFS